MYPSEPWEARVRCSMPTLCSQCRTRAFAMQQVAEISSGVFPINNDYTLYFYDGTPDSRLLF